MKPLTNHLQLINAASKKKIVAVFIGQERIGEGIISEVTEHSVKIGEERYMRENCSFWVKSPIHGTYT